MAQRQFRSDDTDKWKYGFGNGSDGDLTISTNTTEAPIDSSCSGTAGATSLSATNASFAAGQLILIHQSRGTGAGAWELNKIQSYTAGTITLKHALCNTYTDSGASQAQVRVMKQYNNVTVNSGVTWTAKAWDGNVGGILAYFCKNEFVLNGTIALNGNNGTTGYTPFNGGGATGGGYRGGNAIAQSSQVTSYSGEGTSGDRTQNRNANGNGGGGAGTDNDGNPAGGGGNGTAGGNGSRNNYGYGGNSVGVASLTTIFFGGGGGGGQNDGNTSEWNGGGGSGGGIGIIIAKNINTSSGTFNLNGGSGGGSKEAGCGGGGAGGSCLVKSQVANLGSNKITASGGGGGSGSNASGGTGGVGRIHLDYSQSYTGTTTPTLDATLDKTIRGTLLSAAALLMLV